MSATNYVTGALEALSDFPKLIAKSEERVLPEKRSVFEKEVKSAVKRCLEQMSLEIDSEQAVGSAWMDCIQELSKTAHACMNGGWVHVRRQYCQALEKYEAHKRRLQLQYPESETSFNQSVMWMAERGGTDELDLVQRVKESPPFALESIRPLLGIAEQRIVERVGHLLPAEVVRTAAFYIMANLGDSLVASQRGTVSLKDGTRTWRVMVMHKVNREPRGELHIAEGGKHAEWFCWNAG